MSAIKYRRDLYKLFANVGQAVCVELGVAEGLFSRDMLNWGIKKLYSVDLWESHPERTGDVASPQEWHNANYENAVELLKPFGDRSEILRGPTTAMSQFVANDSCDLVYVDADHSYEAVKMDIIAWWPKLKHGGIMAFHDFRSPDYGVGNAVRNFAYSKGMEIYEIPENRDADAGAYLIKT